MIVGAMAPGTGEGAGVPEGGAGCAPDDGGVVVSGDVGALAVQPASTAQAAITTANRRILSVKSNLRATAGAAEQPKIGRRRGGEGSPAYRNVRPAALLNSC